MILFINIQLFVFFFFRTWCGSIDARAATLPLCRQLMFSIYAQSKTVDVFISCLHIPLFLACSVPLVYRYSFKRREQMENFDVTEETDCSTRL